MNTAVAKKVDPYAPVYFEDATIRFRNFRGLEGMYNDPGDRNFCLFLNEQDAEQMRIDGWNVKILKSKSEEYEDQPYIQVSVSYKIKPPRVVLITSGGRTDLPEGLISALDFAEIAKVDIAINPSPWNVNGKTGIKAYLRSIYVTIEEDELEKKYSHVPDSGQNAIGGAEGRLAIESGVDPNEIEAEWTNVEEG